MREKVIRTLYHYTTATALTQIRNDLKIRISTFANNPKGARYGDGVYLTDIEPSTFSLPALSRRLVGTPFAGHRFTHFLAINTDGLDVIECRPNVFVILSDEPLDLTGLIMDYGASETTA